MRDFLVVSVVVLVMGSVVVSPVVAAEAEDGKPSTTISAQYDRGFRFATKDNAFALRINGLLQVRWTYVDYDPAIRFNQDDFSNFFVRRARLYFSGHAGSPKFTYLIHAQLCVAVDLCSLPAAPRSLPAAPSTHLRLSC